ncbi:hypothetical protein MAQ5080_00542 [Marinomonas aquimarina]|uniref:Heparan-alpha-glucosaminide N-acetyltransferase catalytic domain-containing protein n=1 Tax=Marinomonas aquimarina TaxID=295068 RepID=A0A1A8T3T2_9GAMM|nr:heparan-alpha-glucosaminide N-acetyltransferase [Marinomonas aquimarina]SBS26524.1 hypothetical protein MAQ5080_00542 [Marinomonas aquimarina]
MSHQRSRSRFQCLDGYRGLAVVLMIVFHLCWNLRDFGFIEFDDRSAFWVNFRALIVFLFVSAVGWSSYVAHKLGHSFHSFAKNQAKLAFAAALISLGTYLALPEQWVFFGILHFIFAAGWIVRPLSGHPLISAVIGLSLITLNQLLNIDSGTSHRWFIHTFSAPSATLDYINPLPWLGVALIGPIFGYLSLHTLPLPAAITTSVLTFLGRHALLAYLSHQLILFPLVMGAYFLWR